MIMRFSRIILILVYFETKYFVFLLLAKVYIASYAKMVLYILNREHFSFNKQIILIENNK
jgi:hypothetical protein